MAKKTRQYTVSRMNVAKAPWEKSRQIVTVETGSDPLFDSNIYIALVQLIVGIAVFIWAYNLY